VRETNASTARALWRLARPHQWVKNTFVFVGLLFGHAWHDAALVQASLGAFVAFCLVSSAVYAVNDIADRERDRAHPTKRLRPVAAGTLSVRAAGGFASALLVAGIGVGQWVGPGVTLCLIVYVVLNIAYSLGVKRVVILDIFFVAAGFMLRILAGTVGLGIPPSDWLLLCGLMATLFLALVKRRAEVSALEGDAADHRAVLDDYGPEMLDNLIGITAACIILSYSLYTMSPDTVKIHGTERLIYTVPFVAYALFRYIFILHDQGRGGDPSRDLFRDPHILAAGAGWALMTLWIIG
jgi:4-hydroxybenzoate polyprenyltransferase